MDLTRCGIFSQLKFKWGVATLVFSHIFTIDPNTCKPVARSDHQIPSFTAPVIRNIKGTAIPGHMGLVLHTRKSRSPWEWHCNFICEHGTYIPLLFQPNIKTVELKFPGAIKVDPGLTLEIRTGMFGKRNFLGMKIHT